MFDNIPDDNVLAIPMLDNMAKQFLAQSLEKAHKLIISPTDRPMETRFQSHFGGEPYFEHGEEWPVNSSDGTSLDLVCQIVNEGHLAFPNGYKMFQFWFDWEKLPTCGSEEGWLVKLYREIDPDKAIHVKRPNSLPERKFCSVNYQEILTAPDEFDAGMTQISLRDKNYKIDLTETNDPLEKLAATWNLLSKSDNNYNDFLECYIDWVTELTGSYEWDSHIGGHEAWVQSEGTCIESTEGRPENYDELKLLLQLSPTEDFWMNNFGMVYLFYSQSNPEKIYFGMDFT